MLSDYEIALIWLNATVCADAIVMRNIKPYPVKRIAETTGAHMWQRNDGGYTLKLRDAALLAELRNMGFTGRKDADLQPPPVSDMAFAAAFCESRCSFVRQLWHSRKGGKYYVPALAFCASAAILQRWVDIMSAAGVIPPRRTHPACNGTSQAMRITSHSQQMEIAALLEGYGGNTEFWDKYYAHISKPHESYTKK